jgi:Spy/CpxP family protein refolding chaperone
MKLIKKETLVAAILGGVTALMLTVGGVALAHGAPHGGPHGQAGQWSPQRMEAHLAEMTERLDLSAAQQRAVRAIMEDAAARGAEIKEMPRGKEKLVALKDLRFATEDRIYANLSCEQRDGLRLLQREHKVERMERHFGAGDAEDTK